jgi:O-antigen/teichoic acid export membrane protein
LTAALIVGVAGYAASYFVRGLCGGVRWFGGYGLLLLADGAIRVVVALPLVVVASASVAAVAVAAAAAGGAIAPLLSRRRKTLKRIDAGSQPSHFPLSSATRFALPAAAIAGSEQILISGGPLLVLIAGGPDASRAAGVVFAATLLLRAPVFVFQGIAASLLPSLTTFQARGDHARAHRATALTAGALAAFAAIVALGALACGPAAMSLLYGEGFDATRADLAILAVGVGGFLAASTFCQALLARARAGLAALCWTSGAVTFVALELALSGAVFHSVSLAFAGGSAVAVGLLITSVWRTSP